MHDFFLVFSNLFTFPPLIFKHKFSLLFLQNSFFCFFIDMYCKLFTKIFFATFFFSKSSTSQIFTHFIFPCLNWIMYWIFRCISMLNILWKIYPILGCILIFLNSCFSFNLLNGNNNSNYMEYSDAISPVTDAKFPNDLSYFIHWEK